MSSYSLWKTDINVPQLLLAYSDNSRLSEAEHEKINDGHSPEFSVATVPTQTPG